MTTDHSTATNSKPSSAKTTQTNEIESRLSV